MTMKEESADLCQTQIIKTEMIFIRKTSKHVQNQSIRWNLQEWYSLQFAEKASSQQFSLVAFKKQREKRFRKYVSWGHGCLKALKIHCSVPGISRLEWLSHRLNEKH